MNNAPIAITAAATLMPGSLTFRDFWRHIAQKCDFITDVSEKYWSIKDYFDSDPKARDKTYCYRGGFLGEIDFPAVEFGIPPKMLSEIDTSQLLSLIVAKHLLEQAQKHSETSMDDISVILGATGGTKLFCESACRLEYPKIAKAMRKVGIDDTKIQEVVDLYAAQFCDWTESTFPGLLINVITGRITNRLNLGGENCAIDAACASALAAISYGIEKLRVGSTRMVISGGVDTSNAIPMFMCFSKTPALSPTMDIRPFSKDADGTLLGEGIAMIAMKRLEDAERDGDTILGVIRGIGRSSDGRAKSIYAPSPEGQIKALDRCYKDAGYAPESIELVEGHATGTKAGDKSEYETMCQVFKSDKSKNYCGLGSVKSQYGHTKGAAGAVGLVKVLGSLVNRVLLPTIKAENPLDVDDTAFFINTECRPWFKKDQHPRRAGVSAFGFGGTNYHLTIEEYTGENRAKKVIPFTLIPLSGDVTTERQKIEEAQKNGYIISETHDLLMAEYIGKFDGRSGHKAFLCGDKANDSALHWVHEGMESVLRLPKQFNVFAGAQITCAFDCAREYWEGIPEDKRMSVYPVLPPQGILDESYNIYFQDFLKTIFKDFGINVTFSDVGHEVPANLSLEWFLKTLAGMAISSSSASFKPLLDEFDLSYTCVQKPKFSVPLSGYNYGRPTLE